MDVSETNLQTVLGGSKQYRVPLYQRPYTWERAQAQRLWSDIERIAGERVSHEDAAHFMGSLVLSLGKAGPSGTEFLVVDGQQRLTTLSILLAALRDYVRAHEVDGELRAERIHELFLINKFSSGDDRLKLLPTQADRDAFRAIIDDRVTADVTSNLVETYRFFLARLREADDPDDPHDVENIEAAILNGLVFVSITARGGDNVYRIFESLNNTGKALDQGDLLRNYVFMRLGAGGESVYHSKWLPMQNTLAPKDLEQLFWLDIIGSQPLATQSDVYSAQQKRLDLLSAEQVEQEVARWAGLANLLALMRTPDLEVNAELGRELQRLKAWGTTTAEPITLQVLWRRERGLETSETAAAALRVLVSFLVRRVLVGRATAGLNRVLLGAVAELRDDRSAADSIRDYLSVGRKSFATDSELDAAMESIPFYFQGRPAQRKLILQWLEESYGSKEAVDPAKATIEHVLPQTLTAEWRAVLSPYVAADQTVETLHDSLVHTLGNLTLSAYNSELSNRPFALKRELLSQSGFRMNQEIASLDVWGPEQIRSRSHEFAGIIKREWPGPLRVESSLRSGVNWDLAHRAVESLKPGEWTSYGDLAALIGTAAQPMGQHMANTTVEGAWRVLQAGGNISPGFRWYDAEDDRDPVVVLTNEGIQFDEQHRADQSQRVTSRILAERLGLDPSDPLETIDVSDEENERASGFLEALSDSNSPETVHGVLASIRYWVDLGGELDYGYGDVPTCVLLVPEYIAGAKRVRPVAIYPTLSVETAFQHLLVRPPFDSRDMRDELRRRFNEIPGVDISAARIESRPSFPIEILANAVAQKRFAEVLGWFYSQWGTSA